MKTPNVTKALGLPNGLDIEYAITEPALRNLEISMTGHSVGKMRPGAELMEGADHNTYSHKILGDALGAAPELAPVDVAFPDASHYIRQQYRPSDFTGTIQKVYPHQVVDDRFLNHINEYYTKLRKARGFADGGAVEPDKDTMLASLMMHKAPNLMNIKDVGVNEAPDLPIKAFVSPNGGNGEGLPIGGVDFQPLTPGNQMMPMPQPQGGLPPMPGQSPAMPGQSPAPPPRPGQPQSNILALTPQGQAMQAMRPNPQAMPQQPGPAMPKMKKGGGVEVRPTVKDETIQRKIPEMENAVKALQAGTITRAQYDKVVKQHKPVKPYEFVPQPATDEDAERALKPAQKDKWRGHEQWPAGRKVGLRLDIPAYENHGVWVNSIHDEEGSDEDKYPTAYNSVSSVKNATFDAKPEKAVRVATGEQNKSPFARIKGELHHMTEDEAVEHMKTHLNHPDYVQVGMDPRRHGFFYDRKTMKPITHSAHVVQIGPLVLAHKPTYGKRETYADGGPVPPLRPLSPQLTALREQMAQQSALNKAYDEAMKNVYTNQMPTFAQWLASQGKAKGGKVSRAEHDANLAKFLSESKIKDRMYHSTVGNFNTFGKTKDIGYHFGSPHIANERLNAGSSSRKKDQEIISNANVMPVHLSIKQPLRVETDPGFWDPLKFLKEPFWDMDTPITRKEYSDLFELGRNSQLNAEAAEAKLKAERGVKRLPSQEKIELLAEHHKPFWDQARKVLQQYGFDGLTYANTYEGEGVNKVARRRNPANTTYVAFEPNQIKSAIGNRGTYNPKDPDITKAAGGRIKPVGYTKEQIIVSPNLDAMRYELMSVKHYTKKVK